MTIKQSAPQKYGLRIKSSNNYIFKIVSILFFFKQYYKLLQALQEIVNINFGLFI